MNPFEMVVAIVSITAIASIIRAKQGLPSRRDRKRERMGLYQNGPMANQIDPESDRQREEIKALKDRIAVLERVITDTNSAANLDREIEKLR
jgi:hypothetical protein